MTTYLAVCSIENFWQLFFSALGIAVVAAGISIHRDTKRVIAESDRLRKERAERLSEMREMKEPEA